MTINKTKAIEAVGAFLILTAWFLEWGSVKNSEQAIATLEEEHREMQDSMLYEEIQYELQVGYIKSRLPLKTNLLEVDHLRDLTPAWGEFELREAWARHLLKQHKTVALVTNLMLSQQDVPDEARQILNRVNIKIWEISRQFYNGLSDKDRLAFKNSPMFPGQKSGFPVVIGEERELAPLPDRLSAADAHSLLANVVEMQYMLRDAFARMLKRANDDAQSRTSWFRTIYASGGILAVGAFFVEAVGKRKSPDVGT